MKTKVFSFEIDDPDKLVIVLNGEECEEVDRFKYLGSTFVPNGQSSLEIDKRIDSARSQVFNLYGIVVK